MGKDVVWIWINAFMRVCRGRVCREGCVVEGV